MINPLQQQADKMELDAKKREYSLAQEQNQKLNDEHKAILSKYYDNIALYSAGAISFSVTLIGLVLANYPSSLSQIKLYFPNILFLYVSWISFAISFISSLLSKKCDAYYISAFGFTNYTKRYYKYLENELSFIKKYEGVIIYQDGSAKEIIGIDQTNLTKLESAHKLNDKNSKLFFTLMRIFHWTSEISATAGIVFLLTFMILLSQSVIYK